MFVSRLACVACFAHSGGERQEPVRAPQSGLLPVVGWVESRRVPVAGTHIGDGGMVTSHASLDVQPNVSRRSSMHRQSHRQTVLAG